MIDPKELRIGNLAYIRNNQVTQITAITPLDFCASDGDWITWDGIEPIPITPEWLERCGFTPCHINAGSWVLSPNDTLQIDYGMGFTYIFDEDHAGPGLLNIKYIHQLQNLFYALTGEELQIKGKTN